MRAEMGVSTTRGTSAASEAWALMFELMHHSKQRFMAIASEFDVAEEADEEEEDEELEARAAK